MATMHDEETLADIAERCGLATGEIAPSEEGRTDGDSDPACSICRGEDCIACANEGQDVEDCTHDTDEQHGWDS